MNIKIVILWLVLAATITSATQAQGFAGLGTTTDGFAEVVPGRPITLPDDFGAHPDFRIEWWYVTANLKTTAGEDLGVQWTLFRQASKPGMAAGGFSTSEFWMGHAALTTPGTHFASEKLARGGSGQAGANADPFEAWIDDWRFVKADGTAAFRLTAADDAFGYDLLLTETGAPVLHGLQGYSVKSDRGQASYYFSHPFLSVSGTVMMDGKSVAVTGDAWLDREWSSQPLAENQDGWDWFSLRFESGDKLMMFGLRDSADGRFISGTWIGPNGTVEPLAASQITMTAKSFSEVAGRRVPTQWSLAVPSKHVAITVDALNTNSWMPTSISYWEGPVTVRGSHKGHGYLEMTGY